MSAPPTPAGPTGAATAAETSDGEPKSSGTGAASAAAPPTPAGPAGPTGAAAAAAAAAAPAAAAASDDDDDDDYPECIGIKEELMLWLLNTCFPNQRTVTTQPKDSWGNHSGEKSVTVCDKTHESFEGLLSIFPTLAFGMRTHHVDADGHLCNILEMLGQISKTRADEIREQIRAWREEGVVPTGLEDCGSTELLEIRIREMAKKVTTYNRRFEHCGRVHTNIKALHRFLLWMFAEAAMFVDPEPQGAAAERTDSFVNMAGSSITPRMKSILLSKGDGEEARLRGAVRYEIAEHKLAMGAVSGLKTATWNGVQNWALFRTVRLLMRKMNSMLIGDENRARIIYDILRMGYGNIPEWGGTSENGFGTFPSLAQIQNLTGQNVEGPSVWPEKVRVSCLMYQKGLRSKYEYECRIQQDQPWKINEDFQMRELPAVNVPKAYGKNVAGYVPFNTKRASANKIFQPEGILADPTTGDTLDLRFGSFLVGSPPQQALLLHQPLNPTQGMYGEVPRTPTTLGMHTYKRVFRDFCASNAHYSFHQFEAHCVMAPPSVLVGLVKVASLMPAQLLRDLRAFRSIIHDHASSQFESGYEFLGCCNFFDVVFHTEESDDSKKGYVRVNNAAYLKQQSNKRKANAVAPGLETVSTSSSSSSSSSASASAADAPRAKRQRKTRYTAEAMAAYCNQEACDSGKDWNEDEDSEGEDEDEDSEDEDSEDDWDEDSEEEDE